MTARPGPTPSETGVNHGCEEEGEEESREEEEVSGVRSVHLRARRFSPSRPHSIWDMTVP
jgi:hypothetical protein